MIGKDKPPGCSRCPLEYSGAGYVPGEGPVGAPIAILAEQPGYDEVILGRPMVGAAGGMLARILRRTFRTREQFRIENVYRCCPPGSEINKAWAAQAALHCSQYSAPALRESPVILAMGGTAIRQALGLWDWDVKKLVENFHGTVSELPSGQRVVCTYHPSHLQRGAANLMGTVAFDLSVAEDVARGTWQPEPIDCVVDPHPEWFRAYVNQFKQAVLTDPWLALDTDIETPDKAGGKAEDELDEHDASFEVTRINFSYHDDEGVTVPWADPYIGMTLELIAAARLHYLHNGDYDIRRLLRLGAKFQGEIWDGMWLWHHYMSDVPKGLGFVAPFCSNGGAWATHKTTAWKHLFTGDPGAYAGYDPAQGRRVVNRTVEALQARGQWEIAHRHTVRLMQEVLKPAQVVGIQVDRPALDAFEADLAQKTEVLLERLQGSIPEHERPLTGGTKNEGFRRRPEGPHPDATLLKADGTPKKGSEDWDPLKVQLYARHATLVELKVPRKVLCCAGCGAEEVVAKHRCADKRDTPAVSLQERHVVRYFWQEPFNPDSPQQVLGYIKTRRHKAGRNKKTRSDSADRETLVRLRATTKDPFYEHLLDYRGVAKIRGTYAIGVRRRLDAENRFHPVPTLRPSTLRTCIAQETLIEVVRDVSRYPKGIPIEDIRPGMLAYSFDADRRLVLRRVVSVMRTGTRTVVRLYWRGVYGGARKEGHVDLTADHEVRRTDGTWCPAGQLKPHERILSLARGVRPSGYARLWATGHPEISMEHRFIWAALHPGQPAEHVHHRNENKLDNRPENLHGFATAAEHQRTPHVGRWSEARRRMQAAVARRVSKTRRVLRGTEVHNHLGLTKQWMLGVLWANSGKPTAFRDIHGIDYATAVKYLEQHQIDWRGIRACFNGRDERITPALVRAARQVYARHGSVAAQKAIALGYARFRAVQEQAGYVPYNHQVVAVVPLPDAVPVYDLEIEETHNFIAGELCVHNSYVAPNIQNVVADKDSNRNLAAGFRRCVVASPGCKLIELDFSGIEAVQLAWFARDPLLMRLATLGIHAYLASHLLKRPADLSWSDADLTAYFKEIKKTEPFVYDQAKRNVHGNGYGMTPQGMWLMFPHLYKSLAAAKRVQDIYFEVAPAVPRLQNAIRVRAYEQGYIGGPWDRKYGSILDDHNAHPYGYRHDFFNVVDLAPVGPEAKKRLEAECVPLIEMNGRLYAAKQGPDSKRCLAFYPQSTAAGNLKEVALYLFAEPDLSTYIGDAYYGRTPLRAPIHDSLLLEVPDRQVDRVLECAFTEMLRPVEEQPLPAGWNRGPFLTIGVEAKVGDNWEDMEKIATPTPRDLGLDVLNYVPADSLAFDRTYFPAEEQEEEDVSDLGIVVQ